MVSHGTYTETGDESRPTSQLSTCGRHRDKSNPLQGLVVNRMAGQSSFNHIRPSRDNSIYRSFKYAGS